MDEKEIRRIRDKFDYLEKDLMKIAQAVYGKEFVDDSDLEAGLDSVRREIKSVACVEAYRAITDVTTKHMIEKIVADYVLTGSPVPDNSIYEISELQQELTAKQRQLESWMDSNSRVLREKRLVIRSALDAQVSQSRWKFAALLQAGSILAYGSYVLIMSMA